MKPAATKRSLSTIVRRLYGHLSPRRRRQFVLQLALTCVSAFADIVSMGAVLPFLAALATPESVLQRPKVAAIAHLLGVSTGKELILPLTLAFIGAVLTAAAIRMLLLWAGNRLSFGVGSDFSIEIFRRTLYQPYQVHTARNSSEIITGITSKVQNTISGTLCLLALCGASVVLITVMAALLAIDPLIACVAAVGFGSSYGIIAWATRRRLKKNSEEIARGQTRLVRSLQEGLGAIRDILLDGAQPVYCAEYTAAEDRLRRANSTTSFISQSPRHGMEALSMTLVALIALALSNQGGVAKALPILGALAVGAQRLLPALQQAYAGWSGLLASQTQLSETLTFLDQPLPDDSVSERQKALTLNSSVRVHDLRFRYTTDGPWVLDGVDLTIPKGSRIGIVGSTGSGKSTLLDILMGLLPPGEGQLTVDGEPVIGARVPAWQRTIGHVPQAIYLSDASIAENIAFGMRGTDIDMERVRDAARRAQISDFIQSCPEGYDTEVGERGVRLSGGQRQRLGIARALYKKATVLVFDEATSALDNATEQSVMSAIDALDRSLTLVLIAHRLTTVRRCDVIVEMADGKVIAQGTYDELLQQSETFRAAVNAGERVPS